MKAKTCLESVEEIKPAQIRALRQRERLSQPMFAHHLNVSKNSTCRRIWFRIGNAARESRGPALRLLSVIQKHGIEMVT